MGGGAVFFLLRPERAFLADLNRELVTLYRGIKLFPRVIWRIFAGFPSTRDAYYHIRDAQLERADLAFMAARTLYLNRTCFKGMWRHNSSGRFSVGYGGQARRWVISEDSLLEVSNRLNHADLYCSDFEPTVDNCVKGDFVFVDPPYCPGERELVQSHYLYDRFSFNEYRRLALALQRASERGVRWALTISSHPDVLDLYEGNRLTPFTKGTGKRPGLLTETVGEVLICNYREMSDEGIL